MTPPWKCALNRIDSSIRRFASGESDEAFIGRLYGEMLCRPPDAGALSDGTRNLRHGVLRRHQLRRDIASSSEYRRLMPVWRRFLNQLDSSIRRFTSGKSDEAFVVHLFGEMLGRGPDVGALADGTRRLGLGLLRRGRLRGAVASSAEYRSLTPLWERRLNQFHSWIKRSLNRIDSSIRRFTSGESDEEFVTRLYEEMLCRSPDVGALASGARNLGRGLLGRKQLRRQIVTSPEYQALVPCWKRSLNRLDSSIRRFASGESDEVFMARLYGEMLCRPPDAGALSNGTRNLRHGFLRRDQVRKQIVSSSEYRTLTPLRRLWTTLREDPPPDTARSFAASPPEEIWLELTTRCNMVPPCAMCGYAGADGPAPRRDMDPRTWRSLVPFLRQARIVGLHGAGEPLLYPFLDELLEALRSSPSVVGFNSNGQLLSAALSRRLVEKKLGWISISLDAATSGTYLRIRRRPDFEALLSKIRTLREIRDTAGSQSPQIEINMTLMRLNLSETPAFVELAAELGLDRVMFQEIQPGGSQRVVAPDGFVFDYREQELAGESLRDEILSQARERARSLGLQFNCEILYGSPAPRGSSRILESTTHPAVVSPQPSCAEPWKRLLFDVQGNAFVCCIQKINEVLLGRVPDGPIEEIWNGRRIRLVREAMFGGPAPACCYGCYRMSGQLGIRSRDAA